MSKTPWTLTRDMFLSEGEAGRLLGHLARRVRDAAPNARLVASVDRLIVESLLLSGLRNSEFCALRLADTILGRQQSVFAVAGTPREDRTVLVPAALSRRLVEYVRDVRPGLLPPAIDPRDLTQPLIFNERRQPYERTGLYRRVVRILTDAGFRDRASVQFLRHSYGFLAYQRSGGNLMFVQRQLGHAHPGVTAIYDQFLDRSEPDLVERIAAGLSAPDDASPSPKRRPAKHRSPNLAGASDASARRKPQ
ncbi:MAG: site-specific integrase [Planctomyces sp.]|nr:site-specific integrase [Planctomyces sp.]